MYIDLDVRELSYIDYLINADQDKITRHVHKLSRYIDREEIKDHDRILSMQSRIVLGDNIKKRILETIAYSDTIDFLKA